MQWSKMFIPTLRDDPVEAEAPSHRLLLRAGFVRQLSAGHYSLLPLAVRVRSRVVQVIREEMERIDAQEMLFPSLQQASLWEESGRLGAFDVLFGLKDARGQDLVLAPTHEEAFTSTFAEIQSYKALPQRWFQFQVKFRDEARPKGGLLRVREFTMKDSYSFDLDQEGLDASFEAHRGAYARAFARLGIPAVAVVASSGAMGGDASIEFMAPTPSGEDDVVSCAGCGYAANAEKADARIPTFMDEPADGTAPRRFATPGVTTIAQLAAFEPAATAERQIKTLVMVADGVPVLALVAGNRELVEQKLVDALGAATLRPAQEAEIVGLLGASPGSLGAVGATAVRVVADPELRGRTGMFTGANEDGVHLAGVDVERDIDVDDWVNLRRIVEGEPCATCGEPLRIQRSTEVGHIFKLGTRYTESFRVEVLGPDGKQVTPIMGCYGIGVERAIAAVVECNHDDRGIIWPMEVAPFPVAIVPLRGPGSAELAEADRLADQLQARGVEVLVDDRDQRPGVKLADVELIGIPCRVTIGGRGLAAGIAEVTLRATGATTEVPLAEVVDHVVELVQRQRTTSA